MTYKTGQVEEGMVNRDSGSKDGREETENEQAKLEGHRGAVWGASAAIHAACTL